MFKALMKLYCGLTVILVGMDGEAASREKPNILLIMADDFGYECVGANGSRSYKTPHLDELARTGMRFEHCHVQPLCTPTRVELMTGLSNERNYIRFGKLDPQVKTFAHYLKEAGYATCIAGKWQLLGGFEGPRHFGFDDYCLWQLTRITSQVPSRYKAPGLEIAGEEKDFGRNEYGPDLVSDYLCNFMEQNRERPFLAYYPMILTHSPFQPTPDSAEWDNFAGGKNKSNTKHFADMVEYADKIVGKLVRKLEDLKLRDDTLIIFLGDNGTAQGVFSQMQDGRTVKGGKGSTLDSGTHVPLICNWLGTVPAGVVNEDLIGAADFLPTMLDVAGGPSTEVNATDGVSFAPQLRGETGTPRDAIYCWYLRKADDEDRSRASAHARNRRFKLYRDDLFFDVVADPEETQPLPVTRLTSEQKAAYKVLKQALNRTAISGQR